jgi:hypothetical protein
VNTHKTHSQSPAVCTAAVLAAAALAGSAAAAPASLSETESVGPVERLAAVECCPPGHTRLTLSGSSSGP